MGSSQRLSWVPAFHTVRIAAVCFVLGAGLAMLLQGFNLSARQARYVRPPLPDHNRLLLNNALIGTGLIAGLVSGGVSASVGLVAIGATLAGTILLAISSGRPVGLIVAATAPHGGFELAGFLLLGAVGLRPWLALHSGASAAGNTTGPTFVMFAVAGYAFLYIGSVLEAYVTPAVIAFYCTTNHTSCG